MMDTSSKFSGKQAFPTILTILLTQFFCVYGIPINFANNQNTLNDNHANGHPNQPQPPLHFQRSNSMFQQQQQQQPNQNQGPEMEDFGRLKQNQFRRHVTLPMPPHARSAPGAFQPPSEQFGANFHQNRVDESSQQQPHYNHNLRNQPPPINSHGQTEDAQDIHQRSQRHYEREHIQDFLVPPQHHNRFRDGYADDSHFSNAIPTQHHQHFLNENEIFQEESIPLSRKRSNNDDREKIPIRQWQQQQQQQHHKNASGPNVWPVPHPTAMVMIKPGNDGENHALFIEYDISDKDVTSETTVEVDDL